jgi:hypothetical protein
MRAGRLDHPGRQECQGPVRLTNDKMVRAGMALRADDGDQLTVARVERIRDPGFESRTPGIMTPVRPGLGKAIWRRRSLLKP